jgi:hypothetical protein
MCGRNRTEGTIRAFGVVVLLSIAVMLATAASAGATALEYTFSGGNEGWLQTQDQAVGPQGPAGFQSSGGNPGGRLSAKDTGAEDGCDEGKNPCQLLTFYSPFVAPLGANYGGIASFDLRASVNPMFGAELLLLPPGPIYLDGLIPESTGTSYHRLSIAMNEAANWSVCPYSGGACHHPGQSEFIGLISATDVVAVMVDVGPSGINETYDLDNVTLTDGPPALPPPSKKPKKCKKHKRKHKKRAAAAKKCKSKKKRHSAVLLRG